MFVDLKKAYDGVDHALMFRALSRELGITPHVLRDLRAMYTHVRAQVLVKGQLGK